MKLDSEIAEFKLGLDLAILESSFGSGQLNSANIM